MQANVYDGEVVYTSQDQSVFLNEEQRFVSLVIQSIRDGNMVDESRPECCVAVIDNTVIPLKPAICERCRGKGTHANPVFDGTSAEWWEERYGADVYDELDEYMHGSAYDVSCEYSCNGGWFWSVDWSHFVNSADYGIGAELEQEINDQAKSLKSMIDDYYSSEAERRMEERYGC